MRGGGNEGGREGGHTHLPGALIKEEEEAVAQAAQNLAGDDGGMLEDDPGAVKGTAEPDHDDEPNEGAGEGWGGPTLRMGEERGVEDHGGRHFAFPVVVLGGGVDGDEAEKDRVRTGGNGAGRGRG